MSTWKVFQLSALDHVNVVEGREVIPGGPTRQWVDDMRSTYGEGSPIWQARVLGRFPDDDIRQVFTQEMWETATLNHRNRMHLEEAEQCEPLLSVDVARYGDDSTCVAICRGPRLDRFETWGKCDTMETAERIGELASEVGLERKFPGYTSGTGEIVIDSVAMPGVCDRLKQLKWNVREHKGSWSAKESDRFANRRTEAFWSLRGKMESGEVSLPDDALLWEELRAIRYQINAAGKIQLERKEDLKSSLSRSPDRADSTAMAFGKVGRKRVTQILQW